MSRSRSELIELGRREALRRERIGAAQRGKTLTEEHRRNIADAVRRWHSSRRAEAS